MEKRTFHNMVNVKYSKDLFSRYAQRIEHINILTLGKHFEEAIENCNLLIDDIKLKHMINNIQTISKQYPNNIQTISKQYPNNSQWLYFIKILYGN